MKRRVVAVSAALAFAAAQSTDAAEAEGWKPSWDGTLYGYASALRRQPDSVLNPDNQLARLADRSATAELRLNLKAENDALRLTARPILLARTSHVANDGNETDSDAYLSQWQVRLRAADAWNVAMGRDVLNWGPAQFAHRRAPTISTTDAVTRCASCPAWTRRKSPGRPIGKAR